LGREEGGGRKGGKKHSIICLNEAVDESYMVLLISNRQ